MSGNTQARITSVTPQAAEMGAKVPGVPVGVPTTREEYESEERQAVLRKSLAYESAIKPFARKLWQQFDNGLVTYWEMLSEMSGLDYDPKVRIAVVRAETQAEVAEIARRHMENECSPQGSRSCNCATRVVLEKDLGLQRELAIKREQ